MSRDVRGVVVAEPQPVVVAQVRSADELAVLGHLEVTSTRGVDAAVAGGEAARIRGRQSMVERIEPLERQAVAIAALDFGLHRMAVREAGVVRRPECPVLISTPQIRITRPDFSGSSLVVKLGFAAIDREALF